jgi:hypothetical protein
MKLMQKGNFVDTKGVIGSRKSKDRQYNDQIQNISEKYSTTTKNNINCIPMATALISSFFIISFS